MSELRSFGEMSSSPEACYLRAVSEYFYGMTADEIQADASRADELHPLHDAIKRELLGFGGYTYHIDVDRPPRIPSFTRNFNDPKQPIAERLDEIRIYDPGYAEVLETAIVVQQRMLASSHVSDDGEVQSVRAHTIEDAVAAPFKDLSSLSWSQEEVAAITKRANGEIEEKLADSIIDFGNAFHVLLVTKKNDMPELSYPSLHDETLSSLEIYALQLYRECFGPLKASELDIDSQTVEADRRAALLAGQAFLRLQININKMPRIPRSVKRNFVGELVKKIATDKE